MNQIKKYLKEVLEKLPFSMGPKFIVPFLRTCRRHNIESRRMIYAKREALKIRSFIKGGGKHATIIYDNHVSPPTIGDLINVIMIGRYFVGKNVSVKFYIIDNEYRSDWNVLTYEEKNIFVKFQIDLVKKFLPFSKMEATLIDWQDYLSIVQNPTISENIIFLQDKIASRMGIYSDCFNILNFLLSFEDNLVINKVLLSPEVFSNYPSRNQPIPKSYVTWHVRYNALWGQDRNLSADQFKYYLNRISKLHPRMTIIIISDLSGCNHFKVLAENAGVNLIFSKDLNDNFLSDWFIILNSCFYYQLRGGGIGMISMFSSLPYEIVDPCSNEIAWSYPKFTFWADTDQKRYFSVGELPSVFD